jgi:SAM-dependent methyltransferase
MGRAFFCEAVKFEEDIMGIGIQSLNLTLSLWKDGWFEGFDSVVELGSQDLYAPQDEIGLVFNKLLNFPLSDSEQSYTPKSFYYGMNFKQYQCIDVDGRHNALKFDLNKDIFVEYNFRQTFNLVTNHGTSEHCFDQAKVFQNIHNLCTPGGIMLHALPFQGYVNHGFFNYQPCFFRYLAEANNYRIIGLYLNIDSEVGDVSTYSDEIMKHLTLMPNSTMALLVVLQKLENDEFRIPVDGKYIYNAKAKATYQFNKVPARTFMPDPFDIVNQMRTRLLAQTLWQRIKNRIAKIVKNGK